MGAKEKYFVKCPKCGTENLITAEYWVVDMGAQLHCMYCEDYFHASHPESPWKKPTDQIAYTKEK